MLPRLTSMLDEVLPLRSRKLRCEGLVVSAALAVDLFRRSVRPGTVRTGEPGEEGPVVLLTSPQGDSVAVVENDVGEAMGEE